MEPGESITEQEKLALCITRIMSLWIVMLVQALGPFQGLITSWDIIKFLMTDDGTGRTTH
jgi:hypothetical protein